MELKTTKNGTELTVSVAGELNTLTAPELESMLGQTMGDEESLILDFAECDYVSSAGLRVLLKAYKQQKRQGKSMALANVGEVFLDVLEKTGLDAIFDRI